MVQSNNLTRRGNFSLLVLLFILFTGLYNQNAHAQRLQLGVGSNYNFPFFNVATARYHRYLYNLWQVDFKGSFTPVHIDLNYALTKKTALLFGINTIGYKQLLYYNSPYLSGDTPIYSATLGILHVNTTLSAALQRSIFSQGGYQIKVGLSGFLGYEFGSLFQFTGGSNISGLPGKAMDSFFMAQEIEERILLQPSIQLVLNRYRQNGSFWCLTLQGIAYPKPIITNYLANSGTYGSASHTIPVRGILTQASVQYFFRPFGWKKAQFNDLYRKQHPQAE